MTQCPHCQATEGQTTYGRTARGSQPYKCRPCARGELFTFVGSKKRKPTS